MDVNYGIIQENQARMPMQQNDQQAQEDAERFPGRKGKIGRTQIEKAMETLQRYKTAKSSLENRIITNEQWYKLLHWENIRTEKTNIGDPEPVSAWLFNSIANKHADAMDNYPVQQALPREKSDEQDAKVLTSILPVIFEENNFEQTYDDFWWYKLKHGTGVYHVFWNNALYNGLGDIEIENEDLLNLFWQPGIRDIQKSRNLFHVDLIDNDMLIEQYPFMEGHTTDAATFSLAQYIYENGANDTSDKSAVIDWWYKRSTPEGKQIVQYCKFCNGEVLYASENDPNYAQRGYYDHGKYPYVFDVLFPETGSPAGFGYIDIGKSPQMFIDKLDQVIQKHAIMGARPRFFVKSDGGINETEYSDWTKDFVHYTGNGDLGENVIPITIPSLDSAYLTVKQQKIDELKETSSNRDFAQGGTAGGITAASAIAALQEAGSKTSRDMIKASYRAFAQVNYQVIELIRQFYTEEREFRITGDNGQYTYVSFSSRSIGLQPNGNDFGLDMGYRMPIFDIKIASMKQSPFATAVENERAKELYGLGFFNPQLADQSIAALEMMKFEGIEKVKERIGQNGQMYQQIQQLQAQVMQLGAVVEQLTGRSVTQPLAQQMAGQGTQPMPSVGRAGADADAGEEIPAHVKNARARAASGATPT